MKPLIFGDTCSCKHWVAVDLGRSVVKASVLDNSNNPVRLSYSMGDYSTTLLSSVVALAEGKVVVGDCASYMGTINPSIKVVNWTSSSNKHQIARSILQTIKYAAARHYNNQDVGIVLLYSEINRVDQELESIAQEVFSEVKTFFVGDVIKGNVSPNSHLILIADFGEGAFRVTLQERTKTIRQTSNETLGFSTIDMLSLIDCEAISSHNITEIALLAQLMQRVKILLNNGDEVVLPDNVIIKGSSIKDSFIQKVGTFFYQCFDECFHTLKTSSKKWSDVEDIVFVGGGSHSSIIESVFEKYMRDYHPLMSYNSKHPGFDAQYAATFCTMQIIGQELEILQRKKETVVVEH